VLERSREFGIMMAIGYSARQVFALVMIESGLLALVGLLASALLTAGPYLYLARTGIDLTKAYETQGMTSFEIGGVGLDPILKIGIYPENAIAIAIAIVLATLIAGLYPAWRAGRVNPVESINLV
jgi:ABC-type lipoprotein release transport system permease subunit